MGDATRCRGSPILPPSYLSLVPHSFSLPGSSSSSRLSPARTHRGWPAAEPCEKKSLMERHGQKGCMGRRGSSWFNVLFLLCDGSLGIAERRGREEGAGLGKLGLALVLFLLTCVGAGGSVAELGGGLCTSCRWGRACGRGEGAELGELSQETEWRRLGQEMAVGEEKGSGQGGDWERDDPGLGRGIRGDWGETGRRRG